MKVSDYLPNLYKNNVEMNNIIYSEENEFENGIKANIEKEFLNTFPNKTNSDGIERFEKILNIKSNKYSETEEFRRKRIISRLVSSIPFTERFMVAQLNEMLGEGNWNYTIDYNSYKLTINSLTPGKEWLVEVISFLERTVPVNIAWEIKTFSASWSAVENTYKSWDDVDELTWEQLLAGEWLE